MPFCSAMGDLSEQLAEAKGQLGDEIKERADDDQVFSPYVEST